MKKLANVTSNRRVGRCRAPRVCLAVLVPLASSLAHSEQSSSPGPSGDELQEVIVTAEKRDESIKTVPLSMTAIGAADLAARHIQNFQDLSAEVPNLSFSSLGGEGLSNLEIRGISSQAGTATVAVYLDDISLTARNLYTDGAAEPRVFDLERVEVLRGPQGTLYGASALGGTIRFITQQPSLTRFSSEAFVEGANIAGGYDWTVRGIGNIPLITDHLALRLGVERGSTAGYITVLPLDPGDSPVARSNGNDWLVVKPTLLFRVNDALSVRLGVFYQRFRTADTELVDLAASHYVATKGLREPSVDTLSVPNATLDWDVGFGDLTAVTGLYHREFNRTNDVSAANAQGLSVGGDGLPDGTGSISVAPLAGAVYNLKSANYLNTSVNQISEEIRLASKPYDSGANPLTWLVGAYFSYERTHVHDEQSIFGINRTFATYGYDTSDPAVLSGAFPDDFTHDLAYLGLRTYRTKQYAGFGEATFHPTTAIRLTAGVRYLVSPESFETSGNYYYAQCDSSVGGSGCPSGASIQGHSHALTPKFAFGWDVSPDTTLYANITKGFRLGSENGPIPLYGDPNANPTATGTNSSRADLRVLGLGSTPTSYAPDSLWNYEIGEKAYLWNRQIALDLSVFYIRWSAIQQRISLISSGYDFEANAGNAKSYGFESALTWKINRHLKLDGSLGHTRATLDDGVVINGVRVNNTTAGEDIAGVPRWSGALGAQFDTEVSGGDGFVRVEGTYVGASHGSLVSTDPDYLRPNYTLLGASLGWRGGALEATVFAENICNNQRIVQRPNIENAGINLAYRLTPRVIGANLTYSFK